MSKQEVVFLLMEKNTIILTWGPSTLQNMVSTIFLTITIFWNKEYCLKFVIKLKINFNSMIDLSIIKWLLAISLNATLCCTEK